MHNLEQTLARQKSEQITSVDPKEFQDLFQRALDLIIDSLGWKGDELRGEIGQECFELEALFGC